MCLRIMQMVACLDKDIYFLWSISYRRNDYVMDIGGKIIRIRTNSTIMHFAVNHSVKFCYE